MVFILYLQSFQLLYVKFVATAVCRESHRAAGTNFMVTATAESALISSLWCFYPYKEAGATVSLQHNALEILPNRQGECASPVKYSTYLKSSVFYHLYHNVTFFILKVVRFTVLFFSIYTL